VNGVVRAVVQARMSSRRFPGKVLAPFRRRPIIAHVLDRVAEVMEADRIVVATSTDPSDDPLALYVADLGVTVFRGPLAHVFDRFRLCVAKHPCDWILRVNADSPLLHPRVLRAVLEGAEHAVADLVTTIFPRTFPRGQNAELIRVATFLAINERELSAGDQEHVTTYYYRNADRFRIVNVASHDARLSEVSLAVDEVGDLARLEGLTDDELCRLSSGTVMSPTR
jgi:spore coat polysaccharide biosynthesis protein SpsF (cytidylyltransferase family)